MIKNLTSNNINKDKKLLFSFVNAELKETKTRCNIYQGNFYLDSFAYFLINEDFKSFDNLFLIIKSGEITKNEITNINKYVEIYDDIFKGWIFVE